MTDQSVRLLVSWLLVAVLLGYGVVETVITTAKLFTADRPVRPHSGMLSQDVCHA